MAKQISIITFTGRLGNLIGYRRNGQHFLRSMPTIVRQTIATRKAARRFGIASRKGALIRSAFSGSLDISCDSGHINRLTSLLIPTAGSDPRSITGFRFNQYTGTDKFLTLPPELSEEGILHIPSQELPTCKGISELEIKVIATRIHFATNRIIGTESAILSIKTGESFKGAACNVNVPGRGTLVVVLQIRCVLDNVPSCNRKYFAADIIAVQPPQSLTQVLHKPTHQRRPVLKQSPSGTLVTLSTQPLPPVIQLE
ncbi:MAG TPA: hypothetical protein VM802_21660 [Chitinophaga sp.]|uniref:hypothetical protein n=1 Tax=Chitinophaga sp. TaxID=1869181 RepID=UPI002B8C6B43|nr:hypothetical protein [Chitinophaga sp.]HVI47494.1 hypothetical protein [Chitinophaga sp.]